MTTELQSRADLVPQSRVEPFLERLAEKLGAQARAATVFGEPVERDGVTVIPVAPESDLPVVSQEERRR